MPKWESLGFLINPALRVPATYGSQLPHIGGHRQTPVSALGGSYNNTGALPSFTPSADSLSTNHTSGTTLDTEDTQNLWFGDGQSSFLEQHFPLLARGREQKNKADPCSLSAVDMVGS